MNAYYPIMASMIDNILNKRLFFKRRTSFIHIHDIGTLHYILHLPAPRTYPENLD